MSRLDSSRTRLIGWLPAALVALAAGVAYLWKLLSWPPAASVDAWAYAAWGQALARAEDPFFELGATTPKPLAAVLGTVVAPLPPERAFPVVVALAAAGLAAALFAAALREGGAVAAAVAVVALAFGARLPAYVALGYADVVVAALVMVGVAFRGRWRIGALVLAGLLRPEAWVLAAIAGFTETAGSLARRLGGALAAGAAAPVLWILGDFLLTGDPLASLHWHSDRVGAYRDRDIAWPDIPGELWTRLGNAGGTVVVLGGLLGLGLYYFRNRRGAVDWLPLAVVLVWPLLIVLQVGYGTNLRARYLLPVAAVLALGCGLLVGTFLASRRSRAVWGAAAVAAGAVVFVAVSTDVPRSMQQSIARNEAIAATRPTLESVRACGRVGVTRASAIRGLLPQLAASSRRSVAEFGIYRKDERFAAVLGFARRVGRVDSPLPPWPRHATPLGPLAVVPGCGALE
ncbi:MAG: hypothetical protein ACRDNI_00525 [Gaiellaceae bacterium]